MKAFIYLSVLLITAGSAFGLADYFKEQKNGTLAKLYREEEEETAPVTAKESVIEPATSAQPATLVNSGASEKMVAEKTVAKTNSVKKIKKKKERKPISLKMFSRGDEFEAKRFTPPVIIEQPQVTDKKAPVIPVMEEVPAPVVKETTTPVPAEAVVIEKEVKKPSLSKMFSRGRPPKMVKKVVAEVKE